MTVVGVISDTHGLLRPEAVEALRGSAHILHAGDVGAPEVLERLRDIAPVSAVRGNVDHRAWASKLPLHDMVEIEGVSIYLLHILDELDLKPEAAGFGVVVVVDDQGAGAVKRQQRHWTECRFQIEERPQRMRYHVA